MDMQAAAAKVQTLVALRHFVSAFDASECCSKQTQLRVSTDAVVDATSGEKLFLVQQKRHSLHKQRTLLNARNELPVATLRLGVFSPTYSAYPRTEHEETPCSFKFTADDSTVRAEFHDLVGGDRCVLGCDPPTDGSATLNFWLVRGDGKEGGDDVQQTVARLTYTPKSPRKDEQQSIMLDVARGVDLMMMILICIGLMDEGFEDAKGSP